MVGSDWAALMSEWYCKQSGAVGVSCVLFKIFSCIHPWFLKYWRVNFFSKMNFSHNACWKECLLKLVLLAACLMDTILAKCPPIPIRTLIPTGAYDCRDECPEGSYCRNGRCHTCSACPDPYTLAEQGETELVIMAECINKGSCPNSCIANPSWPKGNATMCQDECVDPTPPPPTEPPTCKVGCKHGGCVENGECNCDDGWLGALCDECIPDLDCQNGQCNETERCICNQDWDGDNCDQDVSYCNLNQPCLNDGRCGNDGNGGYTCICSEGFTGAICENETSLHHCERVCSTNGTCIKSESAGIFECHCQDGYTGPDCTQRTSRSTGNNLPFRYTIVILSPIILIVALIITVFFCKKWRIYHKSEGIPGSSSNSEIQLITDAIRYRLEGTTVFLTIKPSWKHCYLKTCKCLLKAPLRISEDDGTEVSVPYLREGFKYNFEIYKDRAMPPDVEDSECTVAECEVSVEFGASGNRESNCAETIGNALDDIATKKSLNRPLEADHRLRERVASFFEMTSDHQKSFLGGQTPDYLYIEILEEVLQSYVVMNKPIGELLSHLGKESGGKTEDFVEILAQFHPTCQSCAQVWHQTHGGTTVSTHTACNGVTRDIV
ncbi:uncharacterized protein LOC117293396 isoform X2 [Asterias rubens]|uniref:uncharacterized protein LOC117293396 isoform X2 n=1 Tax=Asterias rubens TaxID=7604 RepID=UPI001455C793|nr:uncharacterized protein LOC117293396 isoform X2 [Asterias rubens]